MISITMKLNSQKLESFRAAHNEDVRQFSKRIEVSHTWYYDNVINKNGNYTPSLNTITRIASNLNIDPKELII